MILFSLHTPAHARTLMFCHMYSKGRRHCTRPESRRRHMSDAPTSTSRHACIEAAAGSSSWEKWSQQSRECMSPCTLKLSATKQVRMNSMLLAMRLVEGRRMVFCSGSQLMGMTQGSGGHTDTFIHGRSTRWPARPHTGHAAIRVHASHPSV